MLNGFAVRLAGRAGSHTTSIKISGTELRTKMTRQRIASANGGAGGKAFTVANVADCTRTDCAPSRVDLV